MWHFNWEYSLCFDNNKEYPPISEPQISTAETEKAFLGGKMKKKVSKDSKDSLFPESSKIEQSW